MRAGVDVARRNADTARENVQSGLNTAVKGFQRATEQFTQVLGFAGPEAEELGTSWPVLVSEQFSLENANLKSNAIAQL
jgi:hypothetical protein